MAKKAATKKAAPGKSQVKKVAAKKPLTKKSLAKNQLLKKNGGKTNKPGVKNSLVNNINARKEKGVSRPKSAKTVSKKSYENMQNNWGEEK